MTICHPAQDAVDHRAPPLPVGDPVAPALEGVGQVPTGPAGGDQADLVAVGLVLGHEARPGLPDLVGPGVLHALEVLGGAGLALRCELLGGGGRGDEAGPRRPGRVEPRALEPGGDLGDAADGGGVGLGLEHLSFPGGQRPPAGGGEHAPHDAAHGPLLQVPLGAGGGLRKRDAAPGHPPAGHEALPQAGRDPGHGAERLLLGGAPEAGLLPGPHGLAGAAGGEAGTEATHAGGLLRGHGAELVEDGLPGGPGRGELAALEVDQGEVHDAGRGRHDRQAPVRRHERVLAGLCEAPPGRDGGAELPMAPALAAAPKEGAHGPAPVDEGEPAA